MCYEWFYRWMTSCDVAIMADFDAAAEPRAVDELVGESLRVMGMHVFILDTKTWLARDFMRATNAHSTCNGLVVTVSTFFHHIDSSIVSGRVLAAKDGGLYAQLRSQAQAMGYVARD